jgi:hypothetical protein
MVLYKRSQRLGGVMDESSMTYKTRRRNSKDVTQYMWRHIPAAGLE